MVNNQSAIILAKNLVLHDRSKHIDLKFHFLRDCVNGGQIVIEFVETGRQLVDVLTKPPGRLRFTELKKMIDDNEKKKNKPYKKKDDKKKEFYKKKKNGKAYIVGDWLTDIESSSGSSDDESENEKEKLKNEKEKLKKDLEKLSTTNTIVVENLDKDYDMALENEMLKEENKRLKMEKNHDELREENKKLKLEKQHLKTGLSKFTRGKYLQRMRDVRASPPPVPEDARRWAINQAHAEAQKKRKDAKAAKRMKKILACEELDKHRCQQRKDGLPLEESPSPSISMDASDEDDEGETGRGPLDHLPDVGEAVPGALASSLALP
ncbi:uncharacterized protein [Miscanthus floridulus]|uniref:uncharacterized protein n=1 Tax=Miscanthus floridulus TaxID=154761 RepID=UPI00345ADB4E